MMDVLWGDLHMDAPGQIFEERRFFLSNFPHALNSRDLAASSSPVSSSRSARADEIAGNCSPLLQPKTFAAWLRFIFRKDWVV